MSEPLHSADTMKDHSLMLGQIAAEVEEWCISEECTTLDAVRLALADLRKWRGIAERFELERKYWA